MHTALVFCKLPLQSVPGYAPHAANQAHMATATTPALTYLWSNKCSSVRLLRRQHEPDQTRFALAGKMADVCQALDALAVESRMIAHLFNE